MPLSPGNLTDNGRCHQRTSDDPDRYSPSFREDDHEEKRLICY